MRIRSLLIFPTLFLSALAFNKESILSQCAESIDQNIGGLIAPETEWMCLVCKNVTLTTLDGEQFEKESFDISNRNCFIFEGGDVGVVNGDFFKQFPNAAYMIFDNVRISLKASKGVTNHEHMKYLEISKSNISKISQSNALHSLINLSAFEISRCFFDFDNTTIDSELFKTNLNLKDLSIVDDELTQPSNHPSRLKNIDQNALENLINLRSFYIQIRNMTSLPKKLFEKKPKLNDLSIGISCREIPEGINDSVRTLEVYNSNIKTLTRNDLSRFKKLISFGLMNSDLESVDEDTFDDLTHLYTLFLNDNRLTSFTSRHLKNNIHIKSLTLENNPIENLDLKDLPLEEIDYPMNYERKVL